LVILGISFGKRALVTVITGEGFDTAAVDPIISNLGQEFA